MKGYTAMVKKLLASVLTANCALAGAGPQTIRPGEVWLDDRGQHVQAHGGGITISDKTYYWFGEDRSQGLPSAKRHVSCYSSNDLAHWAFRRQIAFSDPADLGPGWVLERPKVFFCSRTRKFVMYMHLDDAGYKYAGVGVATCDKVDGEYKFVRNFRPLGHESRDIGQFVDDDGSAYLIFEDRPFGFRIAALSDDYLDVQKEVCFVPVPGQPTEAYGVGELLVGNPVWD